MDDSDVYEDADSKVEPYNNNENILPVYQDEQNKNNNPSKMMINKEKESSMYNDAQSKISNNSNQNKYYGNSFSKMKKEKKEFELNNKFLNRNNILNNEYEEEINTNKFQFKNEKKEYNNENDNIINYNNNNEKYENESHYSDPEAGNGNMNNSQTLFENTTQKGGCCNLPKCLLF